MKILKYVVKVTCFLLLFCLLFFSISDILSRKSLSGAWDMTNKVGGFYNEEPNEFDVMFFGSSNTYCSFSPLVLWEKTGLRSYVFATQQQPLWATYYYMKEALRTQHPKLMVVDILLAADQTEYFDEGVNHSAMDDIPLRADKIGLAYTSAEKGKRFDLVFPFVKYHGRWNELGKTDFTFNRNELRDPLKGYVLLEKVFGEATRSDVSNITQSTPLLPKNEQYLQKIIDLCKQENIQLLFVKTPNNTKPEQRKYFNTVKEMAAKHQIPYIDYNDRYAQIGLDLQKDFYDYSHLNFSGAVKFTEHFAKEAILPAATPSASADAKWQTDLAAYKEKLTAIKKDSV